MYNSRRNLLPSGPCVRSSKRCHGQSVDGSIHAAQVHFALRTQREWQICLFESGDVVLLRLPGYSFVAGTIAEPHQKFLRGIVDHGRRCSRRNDRVGGIGNVRHEDLVPVGGACPAANILHVEHGIPEILIEDARLDLKRCLRCLQFPLHVENRLVGSRRDIERVHKPQQSSADCNNRSDTHKVTNPESRRAHGDNLAVGCKATEPQQDADEHGHRDGDLERVGEVVNKDLCDTCKRGTVANHCLKNLVQIPHEENEGKDRATNECVGKNLAEDVPGEDAQGQALPLV